MTSREEIARRVDSSLVTIDHVIPLLGAIVAAFAEQDFSRAVDTTLDALCRALGADNAEIFFTEPESSDILLTACRGADTGALVEQTRFLSGSGFPGLVVAKARPLLSPNLIEDPRYLRQSVVRSGITGYLCVPMRSSHGLRGSLNVAWRKPPERIEDHVAFVEQVASLLSTYITAQFSDLRHLVDQAMESSGGGTVADRLALLLRFTVAMTNTRKACAKVIVEHGRDVIVSQGFEMGSATAADSVLQCPCDLIRGGHGDLLESELSCPHGVQLFREMEQPCRLSMTYAGDLIGCVFVDVGGRDLAYSPYLLPLLVMTQQAALHLRTPHLRTTSETGIEVGSSQKPALELFCLGGFEIRRNGEPLCVDEFGRRASLDILKLLALEPGHPRTADALIETLWPEIDEKSGKNRLHVALHALRTVLEPDCERGAWRFVRTAQGGYYLEPGAAVWVDTAQFESLWSKIQAARGLGRPAQLWRRALEQMLDLYRGDLFADCQYDDWSEHRRARLRRVFLEASGLSADILIEYGEFDRAVERLHGGLAIDEFDHELNRRLIELLLATGRRQCAEERYEIYVRKLREELDCEPLPETLELGEVLRIARNDFEAARGRLSLDATRRA